jgi:cystathionine beta-lyase
MAHFDFDTVVSRTGTDCLKFDFAVERGRPAGVLPLWVADMDFPAPPCVLDALRARVEHGIFGYSETKEDYTRAVTGWFARRFGWEPQADWLVKTPGVVFALAMAVRAFTQPGDAVLIQPPVYYPFFEVIRDNDRVLVENPLVYQNGRYTLDLEGFERAIASRGVKLFLLCSPHNPVGRVWTSAELQAMGRICLRHGVTVMSDEIHCDFAFPEHPHTMFLQACPEMAANAVVCTAPSKSFNIAGLQVSNIFIPGEARRAALRKEIDRSGYSQLNTLGLTACKAAYEGGAEWLDACKAYLRANLDFVRDYLARELPQIRLVEPDGTYFAWLDCSGLGLTRDELDDLIVHRAGLWLDAGHVFGGGAEQFQRVVLACPRATLEQALAQLKAACDSLA